jgi:hypothetical protein
VGQDLLFGLTLGTEKLPVEHGREGEGEKLDAKALETRDERRGFRIREELRIMVAAEGEVKGRRGGKDNNERSSL